MIISYAQNCEDVMLWRALKHIENGFYIDVGANDPSIDSVTRLFYEAGWNGINVEPMSTHFQDLQRERPRDINLQIAAGAFCGDVELWECDVRGWASTDKTVIHQHQIQGHAGQCSLTQQSTLTVICQSYAPKEVHFLKIDVEGSERQVLEGMDFLQFRPWIIVIEATRPHSTSESHQSWEDPLLANHYHFVYADGLNRFYISNEHIKLAIAFKYPPNFFDDFVKNPIIESNLWAQTIAKQASDAEARAIEAGTRASCAEARVIEAEARANWAEARAIEAESCRASAETRIADLLESRSWRITAPARLLSGMLPNLCRDSWKAPIRHLVRFVAKYAGQHPKTRQIAMAVLNRFPRAKVRLRHMVSLNAIPYVTPPPVNYELRNLSPRVRLLYGNLKRLVAEHKKANH
jgi:FkbM family methyltransferase